MSKFEKFSCIFVIIVYVIGFIGIILQAIDNLKEGAKAITKVVLSAVLSIATKAAYDGIARRIRNRKAS